MVKVLGLLALKLIPHNHGNAAVWAIEASSARNGRSCSRFSTTPHRWLVSLTEPSMEYALECRTVGDEITRKSCIEFGPTRIRDYSLVG